MANYFYLLKGRFAKRFLAWTVLVASAMFACADRACAYEYLQRVFQCQLDPVRAEKPSHYTIDVFRSLPDSSQYTQWRYFNELGYATYADKLILYFRSRSKEGEGAGGSWFFIPLSKASRRVWRFQTNPRWFREKPMKVDISIDTQTLKGTMSYKFWFGYMPWGVPPDHFEAAFACEKADGVINMSLLNENPLNSQLDSKINPADSIIESFKGLGGEDAAPGTIMRSSAPASD